MRIKRIRTLAGPNVYAHRPVLLMEIDLESWDGTLSNGVPGFIEKLVAWLPGLQKHGCSKRREGGFIERMQEGTRLPHVMEHVALELSDLAGFPANFGKTVRADIPRCYDVVVEYSSEHAMRHLLEAAVELVEAVLTGKKFALGEKLTEAQAIARRRELGPSTQALVDVADRRGIPWLRLHENSLVQLGYGVHRQFIQAAVSGETGLIASEIAGNKELTKQLLQQAFIPVPYGTIVRTPEEAVEAWREIQPPVVVKPLDGHQGKGVFIHLMTEEEVVKSFQAASEYASEVIVEEMFEGKDFRALVIQGKLVAVAERIPAHVIGDGVRTIEQLIEITNQDPRRGEGHEKAMTKIRLDEALSLFLAQSGRNLQTIPQAGETVYLRGNANLSTGGIARDVTHLVHPEVRRMCERAALAIGLDICGVDLIVPSVAQPLPEKSGIVELNASPGLRMHLYPSEGKPEPVAEAIMDMLYPAGSQGRIPLVSLTGTNGKTTTARLIAHLLSSTGKRVGLTTTDGVYIGGQCVAKGDLTGANSARAVLSDPTVELAVLETARGGIVRRGLGYDWSDVGLILNVQPDHFGQDGVRDMDDLVQIKSLVAERVRKGGTLVLNADDPNVVGMLELRRVKEVPKTLVFFSMDPQNPVIQEHLARNGTAFLFQNGHLVEASGDERWPVAPAESLPITFRGLARFNIINSLAALAVGRAMGLSRRDCAAALTGFQPDRHNPGRTNLYRIRNAFVLVDYAHNPEAFRAISALSRLPEVRLVTAVMGVPGDRTNDIICQSANVVATSFHRIIIKEDDDLRGRQPGEVANLLFQEIKRVAPSQDCTIMLDEREALRRAIEQMEDGELTIVFFDKLAPLTSVLEEYGAVPVGQNEFLSVVEETTEVVPVYQEVND